LVCRILGFSGRAENDGEVAYEELDDGTYAYWNDDYSSLDYP